MNIVVSSGNDGVDIEEAIHFPALNNGVITVSNITSRSDVGFIINTSSK